MNAVEILPAAPPPGAVGGRGAILPAEGTSAAVFVNASRPRRLPTAFGWVVLLGALVNVVIVMLLFVYWLIH